jgi:ketosteroid isomerase-like protein
MAIRRYKILATPRNLAHAAICCGSLALLLLTASCGSTPKDTRAADETTIRNLDEQWAKSVAAKDVDATVGYYSDDASLLAPNEPIASDKPAIRAQWSALLGADTSLTWQATKVDVARSSDLGYIVGAYQLSAKDAQGPPTPDRGKFVEVWKKQADASWKVVADIFNSDLALLTPAPAAAKKGAHHPKTKKKAHGHSHSAGM